MALNVITLLLVLGITFMHSIFGLFSGLINVFCSLSAMVIAFGFYEPLSMWVSSTLGLSTAYVEPCTLVALFLLSLTLLRFAADNLVRGNVNLPPWLDWGGAIACGLVNAQIAVGMLAIGVMMLPIGGQPLGFARYERSENERHPDHDKLPKFERRALWTRSDEMTVAMFNMMSGGSLAGSTVFDSVYPDFTDAVYFSTNTVQPESSPTPYRDKGDGFAKGITVESWWEQKSPFTDVRYRIGVPTKDENRARYEPGTFSAAGGKKIIGVRLQLDNSAADRTRNSTVHLFRPTMFRLVGAVGDDARQYTARAFSGNADTVNITNPAAILVVNPDNNFRLSDEAGSVLDVYFEVDDAFRPKFVEYRRHARERLDTVEMAKGAPSESISLQERTTEDTGPTRVTDAFEAGTGLNTALPFVMSEAAINRLPDVTLSGDLVVKARVSGARSRFEPAAQGDRRIERFVVPEGKRMVQIRYTPQKGRTLVGQVFNFVGQLNQYTAIDSSGNPYELDGYWAVVKRGNSEYVEMFFNGPKDDQLDPSFRGMLDFKDVTRQELNKDDTIITLVFLVNQGAQITKIKAGANEIDVRISAN